MEFEKFKKLIELLKKDSEDSLSLYKLGLDCSNLKERLDAAITILLESYFTTEGEDIFSWWIYESVEKKIYNYDGTVQKDLTKIEDLYEYVMELKNNPTKNNKIN